ncbi:uncharacterized protein LOC116770919 [Danaus plexippus]|uniref:uncharacterized protein LOC116770919 n=1 Tax=Danaus plexippus TaxID=13037 RepID=UPI002AAF7EB4|nr:uncharacterized protein LOC116770919 [Danaus plexippus]
MRVEIPECKRCCCCLPLRHGILIFGYLNLLFSLFVVALEIALNIKYMYTPYTMAMYKGVSFYSQVWFALVLYIAEIVFNIVLLVGAHTKKTKLLRVFYYYGITTTLASLVTFIVVRQDNMMHHWAYYIVEGSFVICGLSIQAYLLLLVRSELLKLRHSSRLCYVNHAAEVMVETPIQLGRNPF